MGAVSTAVHATVRIWQTYWAGVNFSFCDILVSGNATCLSEGHSFLQVLKWEFGTPKQLRVSPSSHIIYPRRVAFGELEQIRG